MSCNKDFACSFDVHAKAAKRDVKFTLHQINCFDRCPADGDASSTAVAWGHVSWPSNELRTLADYRVLHAPLRSDSYSKNRIGIGELAGLNRMDSSRQRYL